MVGGCCDQTTQTFLNPRPQGCPVESEGGASSSPWGQLRAQRGFGPPESAASSPGGRDLRDALSRGCLNEGSQKSLQETAFYTLLGQVGTRDPRAVSAAGEGRDGQGLHWALSFPLSILLTSGFPSHIFATQERLSSSLVSSEDLREGPCPVPNLQQS